MAVSIVMPALEMAQDAGKLIAWRKKEGEPVRKGEALLEIETDKAVVEIEAPGDGILAAISAHPGAVVPVGRTIAWLLQPGESPPAPPIADLPIDRPIADRLIADVRVSPKARRLAQEHGIDIATLRGSGPDGEILAADIESAIANKSSISNLQSAMSSFARVMAARTTESWTTVPHFFLTRTVDAGALTAARGTAPGVSPTDLLVSIVARALAKHPRMNASWINNTVRMNRDINVAIAIAVDDAVVTGVILQADRAALDAIATRRTQLAGRARAGRLQHADIAGATFTISNLGMYGIDAFTAIIVPPQTAILAVGAIADRVVAVDGRPSVRPTMTLTLSCDHRVVDGARAAAFLADVVAGIERASGPFPP